MRNQNSRSKDGFAKLRLLRPRTIYYVGILCLAGGVMLYTLLNRSPLELHVLHDRNPLFVKLSDGTIRNGYDIKILNKTHDDKSYTLTVNNIRDGKVVVQGAGELSADDLTVFADKVGHYRIFLLAPQQQDFRKEITFEIKDNQSGTVSDETSIFISSKRK
jgi:polyferredoxin